MPDNKVENKECLVPSNFSIQLCLNRR